MKKIVTGTVMASVLFIGMPVFAQEEFNISELVQELRAEHENIKAQVDAGDITKVEAYALWQSIIDEVRVKKEEYFNARMDQIQARVGEIAKENSERAAMLSEKVDAIQERRQERTQERQQIRNQLQAGEITREQAREMRSEMQTEAQKLRSQSQKNKTESDAQRAERMENRPEGAQPLGEGMRGQSRGQQ